MNEDSLTKLINRLKRIGIELHLVSNYPWIYLSKVNGIKISETFMSDYGYTIGYSPKEEGGDYVFPDLDKTFDLIRKYKKQSELNATK